MTLSCSTINDTSGLCTTLESVGVGIGVMIQALGQSLPYFILLLAVIGGVVGLFGAIIYVVKRSMSHVSSK